MNRIESSERPKGPHSGDPHPHVLGRWSTPGGNAVVVTFTRCQECGSKRVTFDWRNPPPLNKADVRFYRQVLEPRVVRLVAEYTEEAPARPITVRGFRGL
jgi:hypothetical protein